MRLGGELQDAVIAYETWGEPNAARDNAILLFTGLSPSAHAASSRDDPSPGWWQGVIGPQCAIDTQRWFVVCVNSLGSCFGSTGPASINPRTQHRYRLDFPRLAIEDIAAAGRETLRYLGIERLAAVAGASLGGMASLAFIALFPGLARRVISVSGSDAASPFAIALRSVQREAIVSDSAWQNGQYPHGKNPRNGMRLARKIGTITYRSAREWEQRYGRKTNDDVKSNAFTGRYAVEQYLESQAERFVTAFDANCYLYLSRAMDDFDLNVHGGLTQVARRAQLDAALVIGVETDMLFRLEEQQRIAAGLQAAGVSTSFVRVDSAAGHDAFLADLPPFQKALAAFFSA